MKHLALVIILLFAVLCMPLMAAEDAKLSTYTYNLQKGWNLIGIVLDPTDESEQELLAHKLYDYNGEKNVKSYQQSAEVTAGKSYWIYSDAGESLVIKGTRIDSPTDDPAPQEGSYALVVGPHDERTAGEEVTVTAPAKEGYSFVSWTVDGVSIPDTTQETINFTMPTNKVTLATNYQINSYILTVDGVAEQVTYGTEVSKTAATKEGYVFKGWTVAGVSVEDETVVTLNFNMPANDVTITPNYAEEGLYIVVYLTDVAESGIKAGDIKYTSDEPDLNEDTCRSTELWLRHIPAGTFTRGSPEDEVGRSSSEYLQQVTLTDDFYIGIFEMTQKQYELINGDKPSKYIGDNRPVEQVSYDTIRGTSSTAGGGWPSYGHTVDSDSFLEKLRNKTGLVFDLPTEAQWEYACRAETTTALNTGSSLMYTDHDAAMDVAGRYTYDKSDGKGGYAEHTKVGLYQANNWGLYDMHGNVWEWCLDYYGGHGSNAVVDPVGRYSDFVGRTRRGGSWKYEAQYCRSAKNEYCDSSFNSCDVGFRVVMLPNITP